MKEIILAYQGEMTLKGLNRSKFEARLAKSIRYRLEDLGKFKVTQARSPPCSLSHWKMTWTWTKRSAVFPKFLALSK